LSTADGWNPNHDSSDDERDCDDHNDDGERDCDDDNDDERDCDDDNDDDEKNCDDHNDDDGYKSYHSLFITCNVAVIHQS
jgi:hypothetical protein